MNKNKLQKEIDKLNPWFCPVQIKDIKVVPGVGSRWNAKKLTSRILYRNLLLVNKVLDKYDFSGKRILDLGCNCGYWPSIYAQHGAKYVLGVEGRENAWKQAKLYWKENKFLKSRQYKFLLGDVTSDLIWKKLNRMKKFDVCLCAGLLYHIPNYRLLLHKISNIVNDLIIIDTRVGNKQEAMIKEPGDLCFNAIDSTLNKTVPNLKKLIRVLKKLSFELELLKPPIGPIPIGLRGEDDYTKHNRITLLAWKITK